jgi:hypothetical protein
MKGSLLKPAIGQNKCTIKSPVEEIRLLAKN